MKDGFELPFFVFARADESCPIRGRIPGIGRSGKAQVGPLFFINHKNIKGARELARFSNQ